MLSKTLQDGLNHDEIGASVRALLKKKIGLVDLGKHTGLSPALLSKIERGRLFPTLPTLLRMQCGRRDRPLTGDRLPRHPQGACSSEANSCRGRILAVASRVPAASVTRLVIVERARRRKTVRIIAQCKT